MSDELDPGLRRLFAETAETTADEAFVQGVTVRTTRERRMGWLARVLIGVAAVVLVVVVGGAVAPMLGRSAASITALVTASPFGWAIGLALVLAGGVCVRTLAPVLRLPRS